jgi:enoyl-CoA hydratase/carnithine racemase
MRYVAVERRGPYLWITFDRPAKLNVLHPEDLPGLRDVIANLDPDVRGLVFTGAGDRAFSAGMNIEAFTGLDPAGAKAFIGQLAAIMRAIRQAPVVTLAAVSGYCLGGAFELALACDLRVVTTTAVFGLPEIKVGLLPFIVMAPILRSVGRKRGMLMILSGEQVSAREACEMGLVSRLVPRVELGAAVDALARTLAGYSPTALGLAKEAAATATGLEYGAALRYLREMLTLVALSDDAKEGIAAFFEKRPPRWSGR